MRVLHLSAGNLYGGIERLLVTLARERHHAPEMDPHFGLCFDGQVAGELRAADVPVHLLGEVRFSRPWTVWRARHLLRSLLVAERFDAVVCHACWPHALFAPTVRTSGLPLIFWSHDAPAGTHWLERRAARTRPDLVLANSRYTLAAVPNLFPGARRELMYLPVRVTPARPTPPTPSGSGDEELAEQRTARPAIRSRLGTRPDNVVILTACRLEPWKGHRLLLEALGHLRNVSDWECWIAGGPQRPHEQVYSDELHLLAGSWNISDRVKFLGQRSDVPELLSAADIHCQPNTGPEPFGIAFVEALYAGLPVVTTSIGAAQEIVTQDCGVLVASDNPAALAEALENLITDGSRRKSLGACGPARARELCDPGIRIREIHGLLAGVKAKGVAA